MNQFGKFQERRIFKQSYFNQTLLRKQHCSYLMKPTMTLNMTPTMTPTTTTTTTPTTTPTMTPTTTQTTRPTMTPTSMNTKSFSQ